MLVLGQGSACTGHWGILSVGVDKSHGVGPSFQLGLINYKAMKHPSDNN